MAEDGLTVDEQGCKRCWWCGDDPLYMDYHDHEWGRPVTDNVRLFEKICLEGFQAGLSWITILRKRENFRTAFDEFDFTKIVKYTESDVERLVKDAGIIRHRGKIESTINNAKRALELEIEFGSLAAYFWQWQTPDEDRPTKNDYKSLSQITMTEQSKAMSKDLKKRGWSFVGPTTAYAFMQAMGLVNDHHGECHVWSDIEKIRKNFTPPA